jgi:gliding motility-associated-like protein
MKIYFSTSILTSLFILSSFNPVFSQKWGYYTTSNFTNEAMDVQVDASQNSYVCGYYTGETSFTTNVVEPSPLGNGDIYVAKLGPSGNYIWRKGFGGNLSDRAYKLAIGPDQNIVVVGQFFGTVQFGNTTLSSSANSKDIFIVKLDPSGNVIWAKREGGASAENVYDVTIDNANNVLITGQYTGNSVVGGQNCNSLINPISGLQTFDFFISKYDNNGNPIWVKTGATEYEDRGLAIDVDADNNVFFAGQFSDTLLFDNQVYNNAGYNVGFVTKISPAGSVQFFNYMRAGMVVPYDLEVNSDNEVLLIGDFLGNLSYITSSANQSITNPYDKQIFALKISNTGQYIWNRTLGSANNVSARSIAIDANKQIFITGFFECEWTQMQETNTNLFNSIGFKDPYLLSLSNDSDVLYNKHFGSKKNDQGWGIACKQNGDPVICGGYTDDLNVTFDMVSNYGLGFQSSYNDELPHLYLPGDISLNSFVTNAVFSQTPEYNYYHNLSDSPGLFGEIEDIQTRYNPADTIHLCPEEYLFYNTYTFIHSGPDYNYLWSTNDSTQYIAPTVTQNISIQVERKDECQSDADTVFVIYHPAPTFPLLIDDHGYNIGTPVFYNPIFMCDPDTVILNFNTIDPDYNFSFNNSSSLGPISIDVGGGYPVLLSNQYCTFDTILRIIIAYPVPYDSISLGIKMDNADPDSITICLGEEILFWGVDYITNPLGYLQPINQPYVLQDWSISPSGSMSSYSDEITADATVPSTGWYTIRLDLTLGYQNFCGLDTTQYHASYNVHITVNPNPIVPPHPILGSNLLCPDGSLYLHVATTDPQLSWQSSNEGNIVWASATGDSIQIINQGVYTYGSADYIDSITGCSAEGSNNFLVNLKQPPLIVSAGNSNVICPNDSLQLSVPAIFTSYEWINPNGIGISTTNTSMAVDQGFYYCHVIDNQGCALTSPIFELNEYTTPSLFVTPSNILCAGDVAQISVNYDGNNASVNWLNPLGLGNVEQVLTSSAGVFLCEISACGITTLDSAIIIDGNFTPIISVSDSILCYQETALISGTPANASFSWNSPDGSGSSFPTSVAGAYYADVINEYGCEVATNHVTVSIVEGSILPLIADVAICSGTSATLNDNSPFVPNWYTTDSVLVANSDVITTPILTTATSYLVAYPTVECPLTFGNVTVSMVSPLPNFILTGDADFCQNSLATFSVNTNNESVLWQINGVTIAGANDSSFTFNINNYPTATQIMAQVSNLCYSTNLSQNIVIHQAQNISILNDSIVICFGDTATLSLLNTNLDSIIWSGNFGMDTSDVHYYPSSNGDGTVFVSAIDTFGCTANPIEVNIQVPIIAYTFSVDTSNLCLGENITVQITTDADSIQWIFPNQIIDTTEFSFQITTAGTYILNQWNAYGCLQQDSFELSPLPLPVFNIAADTIYCLSDYLNFVDSSSGNAYIWTTLLGSTEISLAENQSLVLTSFAQNGCEFLDTIVVLSGDCIENIPNIFSPNGDGVNDFLYLGPEFNLRSSRLEIVNRWGVRIFEMDSYNNTFDGANLVDGVYFYTFYQDFKAHPEAQEKGFIHIVK